jgi:hypothetical protein
LLSDLQDTPWERDLLSVKTLQNVKDLALDLHFLNHHKSEEPVWPTTWSQLTNLTRLAFRWTRYGGRYGGTKYLPYFLMDLKSLRDAELATKYHTFGRRSVANDLVLLSTCLTQLTRMQINIQTSWDSETDGGAPEGLEHLCQTVIHRVPGMLYAPFNVNWLECSIEGRLVFTWTR